MIMVGTMLYGYCGGEFGRDGHADKRVEGVGVDWVVARDSYGDVFFASGDNIHESLAEHTKEEDPDDL